MLYSMLSICRLQLYTTCINIRVMYSYTDVDVREVCCFFFDESTHHVDMSGGWFPKRRDFRVYFYGPYCKSLKSNDRFFGRRLRRRRRRRRRRHETREDDGATTDGEGEGRRHRRRRAKRPAVVVVVVVFTSSFQRLHSALI